MSTYLDEQGRLRQSPRSESKTKCPECGREPGGIHKDSCPRSRVSLKLRDAHLGSRENRFVCPPKNVPMRVAGEGPLSYVVNPGIPYVRSTPKGKKPGKPWYAGGIPAAIRHSPIVREVLLGQRPTSDLLSGRL